MSGLVSDYDFDLPPELIASRPLAERDASRMLVLHREDGRIEHRSFRDFPSYLKADDIVVLNDSRVIKARLFTEDRRIEIMLVESQTPTRWVALVKPGRKLRVGVSVAVAGTVARVVEVMPEGERVLEFDAVPDLETHGVMPIPPYFKRPADEDDAVRYQTVFAGDPGSVAAPTAGLHFTPELLATLPHTFVTLHVGMGTFQPVKVEQLAEHRMHEERYTISEKTAKALNSAGRIVAVGTTASRVLESQQAGPIQTGSGATSIFIHPPYQFQHVGALLTNFHLPKSTLLMLISAMAGRELVMRAYAEAVKERYRFFSYGDCMLII